MLITLAAHADDQRQNRVTGIELGWIKIFNGQAVEIGYGDEDVSVSLDFKLTRVEAFTEKPLSRCRREPPEVTIETLFRCHATQAREPSPTVRRPASGRAPSPTAPRACRR